MVNVTAESVASKMDTHYAGSFLLDIRRDEEVLGVTAAHAVHVPRDMLEIKLAETGIESNSTVYLMCQSGERSRYAAQALRHFGYANTWSMEGGFRHWKQQGLPLQSVPYLDRAQRDRFASQLALGEFGLNGQSALGNANVLLIGAGGLSSPAALYLAAMGVGTLQIIDDDTVELSNLQRQIMHSEETVGAPKVKSAAESLGRINSDVTIQTIQRKFDSDCGELVKNADVVINGADNFAVRYAANDLCLAHGTPLVDGSVLEMEGQLSVFCHDGGPCYRCLYPETPPASIAPSCVMAGVLGVVPGVIGTLQALEAVKLITNTGTPLSGVLQNFDARTSAFQTISFSREPDCLCSTPVPAPIGQQ